MSGSDHTFLGGLFIGVFIAFILYGIFIVQVYIYSLHCKEDTKWLKCLVSVVMILETLHTALMFDQMYHYAVTGFGRPDIIEKIDWTVAGIVVTENIAVALVQGFYVYRVWLLSNNSRAWVVGMVSLQNIPALLPLLIGILVFSVFTSTRSVCVTTHTWAEYQTRTENKVGVNLANITSVVADTAVAVAMVYHLSRSERYFKRTDSVLRWLIAYSVNTGVLTMLFALATIITYAYVKDNLIYAGLVVVSGKICANSMLGALNARHVLRDRLNDTTYLGSGPCSTVQFRSEVDQESPVTIDMSNSEVTVTAQESV
ncbi:hypothetical protein QCA50_007775 [Cerrena zonata]|uniref:DUF6534 domain-containing protein n=1 Tax=Cerrena zonata TaxID=2478898 RepID=A0AAW0GBQ8_9APHY